MKRLRLGWQQGRALRRPRRLQGRHQHARTCLWSAAAERKGPRPVAWPSWQAPSLWQGLESTGAACCGLAPCKILPGCSVPAGGKAGSRGATLRSELRGAFKPSRPCAQGCCLTKATWRGVHYSVADSARQPAAPRAELGWRKQRGADALLAPAPRPHGAAAVPHRLPLATAFSPLSPAPCAPLHRAPAAALSSTVQHWRSRVCPPVPQRCSRQRRSEPAPCRGSSCTGALGRLHAPETPAGRAADPIPSTLSLRLVRRSSSL